MKFKLGIIGTGVMANAIIDIAINSKKISPKKVIAFDIDENKLEEISKKGITPSKSLDYLINNSEIVMLSVKPQHYAEILEQHSFENVNTIISIMAGVKVATIKNKLHTKTCGIARVMPNAPCKIGMGYTGLFFDGVKKDDTKFITELFSACGETEIILEEQFDALTSISGSGPAYVYMFINGIIKGGLDGGLSYDQAKNMAISTIIGATSLASTSTEEMDSLVEKVCSKGGTTIEAVNVFRRNKLEETLEEGIRACRKRSKELSESL